MTTRSEFDPSLARNYYDLWGTYSDANELLYARVAELEASLQEFVSIEPDRHRESMSYFPPHKEGCIWCHAKRLLDLI